MSKIGNAITMLFYLNAFDGFVKIQDISAKIEIGVREVRRYRDDLEMAGFSIENKTGRNGGYRLLNKIDPVCSLSQTERLLINFSMHTNQNVLKLLNTTLKTVSKLKSDYILGDDDLDDKLLYKLVQIGMAIEQRRQIHIQYRSPKYGDGSYLVGPYFLRLIRNRHYLFALESGKLKSYDVRRILEITPSTLSYSILQELYEKEMNETAIGIYRGDCKHLVEIEVFGTMNNYVESYFGRSIRMVQDTQRGILYSFETYDLHETLYTVLSLASHVCIRAPIELKNMYLGELSKMKSINE